MFIWNQWFVSPTDLGSLIKVLLKKIKWPTIYKSAWHSIWILVKNSQILIINIIIFVYTDAYLSSFILAFFSNNRALIFVCGDLIFTQMKKYLATLLFMMTLYFSSP
jgi:hypothetical protein